MFRRMRNDTMAMQTRFTSEQIGSVGGRTVPDQASIRITLAFLLVTCGGFWSLVALGVSHLLGH